MPYHRNILVSLLVMSCGPLLAQDQAAVPTETRVVKKEAGQSIEEFRVEGRLESISITPPTGPAYFIDDRYGDGTLTSSGEDSIDSDFNIRTWKLGTW